MSRAAITAPAREARPKPTPAQVACICGEIAELAQRLDREFFHNNDGAEDCEIPERASLFLDRLRDAIARIGWLADLGADIRVRDDAREWLLSPIFFSELVAGDGAEGGAT